MRGDTGLDPESEASCTTERFGSFLQRRAYPNKALPLLRHIHELGLLPEELLHMHVQVLVPPLRAGVPQLGDQQVVEGGDRGLGSGECVLQLLAV